MYNKGGGHIRCYFWKSQNREIMVVPTVFEGSWYVDVCTPNVHQAKTGPQECFKVIHPDPKRRYQSTF